jgi:hypothetical protein
MTQTAEQSTCPWRSRVARASDPGAGEGFQGTCSFRPGAGLREFFLLAANLVAFLWPIPSPIRDPIPTCLAAFPDPDSAADLDPAVWRFRHGEEWLFRVPGVPWR